MERQPRPSLLIYCKLCSYTSDAQSNHENIPRSDYPRCKPNTYVLAWQQALKEQGRASAEDSSKTVPLMKKNVSTRGLHLLAASPPFILALEQALVTVVSVDQAASPGPLAKRTRLVTLCRLPSIHSELRMDWRRTLDDDVQIEPPQNLLFTARLRYRNRFYKCG